MKTLKIGFFRFIYENQTEIIIYGEQERILAMMKFDTEFNLIGNKYDPFDFIEDLSPNDFVREETTLNKDASHPIRYHSIP